jgi:hypothetical protein
LKLDPVEGKGAWFCSMGLRLMLLDAWLLWRCLSGL